MSAAESNDLPPVRRVHRLNSLGGVRLELASVYKDAHEGRLRWSEASRAGNLLAIIARIIEGSELERRVEALEARRRTP